MSLPSNNLDAFTEIAKVLNFSTAAKNLHVTQSALSQRIQKLEEELQTTLFIRTRGAIRLTDTGEKLLRYCHAKSRLEEEVLETLKTKNSKELAGIVRIAGFSSVMRSAVIPSLAPLLRNNPKVLCEFKTYEMSKLIDVLQRGEADFIILDQMWEKEGIERISIGHEEYVMIESKQYKGRENIYLDHDSEDPVTFQFFREQNGKTPSYHRAFMGDVYSILEGVELGIGRAVMPRHLVRKNSAIKILPQFKMRKVEVFLYFFEQPYYSKLHEAIRTELKSISGLQ